MVVLRAGISEFGEVVQLKRTLKLKLFKKDSASSAINKIMETLSVLNIVNQNEIDDYEYAGRVHISAIDLQDLESGALYTLYDEDLRDLMKGREACLFAN